MAKESNEIIIDLFASNLPGSTEEDDLIQKSLRDQLVKSIRSSITSDESKDSSDVARFIDESGRNVFFVDGTRGAGKTTFINSVVERLNKDKKGSEIKIKCLPTIDPTKLPRHEPILVTVTARLNMLVSKKLNENWSSDDHKKKKEQWQNQLEKLKRGLHLLTDKEYKPEYFSDALKLDAQLDYSIGGQDLSEIFDKLVECSCDILECGAILISFDDIDTQFDTGWEVLESIRRFFNSKRLLVIATGDLRLYSQLIRGKQYSNYEGVLLSQENQPERVRERGYMVEHLEQQYLLKIFPVQKRIHLDSVYRIYERGGSLEVYTKPDKKGKVDVSSAIENALHAGLYIRKNSSDMKMCVSEILKQPIRLLMQFLQDYYTSSKSENSKTSERLRRSLYGAMLSSIYRVGLNYDQGRVEIDTLTNDIYFFIQQDKDFNTGFYLRPQSEQEALRNCAMYLSSGVSSVCEGSFSSFLNLLLVGCGSVTLLNTSPRINSQIKDSDFVESFRAYMSIGRNESLSHWANRACAILSGGGVTSKKVGMFPGVIQINSVNATGSGDYKPLKIDDYENGISKMALRMAFSSVQTNVSQDYLSVFNIIGGLADIAAQSDEIGKKNALMKSMSQTTCISPPWHGYDRGDQDSSDWDQWEDEEVEGAEDGGEDLKEYKYASILEWISLVEKYQQGIKPSALLVGKIWTRFYFNLSRIDQEHRSAISKEGFKGNTAKLSNAAKFMRYSVIALLNAVLLEEDEYHISHERPALTDLERNNPVNSVDNFVKQFEQLEILYGKDIRDGVGRDYPIFFILINCPVVHAFLFAQGSVNSTKISNESKLYNLVCDVVGKGLPCPDLKSCSSLYEKNETHAKTIKLLPDDNPTLVIEGLNKALIAGSKSRIGA